MAIRIYNTMTQQKEVFEPLNPGKVGIYSCGPTVYDYFHLGNARAFVVPDIIKRYLEYRGYQVTLVQNITDIDDKIIKRAADEGVPTDVIVDTYTEAFFEDREKLGVMKADVHPRATQHISQIIKLIEVLKKKDIAYEVDGDVYYDVSKFPSYGKLSGQNLEELEAGARVDVDAKKRNPMDFALWKKAKPGEPKWSSPWGEGRPGWHIECSAMSMTYLGDTFDIHTGGQDLIFPHHENEIAQSEAATEAPFVKYWVHNGHINVDGEKMSKSLGNFFTLREILEKYPADAIRFFLISSHYRSPINFSDVELAQAARGLERLKNTARNVMDILGNRQASGEIDQHNLDEFQLKIYEGLRDSKERFISGMDDDFNTAIAISALHDLARDMNVFMNAAGFVKSTLNMSLLALALDDFVRMAEVLGIELLGTSQETQDLKLVDSLMALLLEVRDDARKRRDWETADKIRDQLKELNILVEDTPQGGRWRMS
jgi:cysteinyl-tRNA synthetase